MSQSQNFGLVFQGSSAAAAGAVQQLVNATWVFGVGYFRASSPGGMTLAVHVEFGNCTVVKLRVGARYPATDGQSVSAGVGAQSFGVNVGSTQPTGIPSLGGIDGLTQRDHTWNQSDTDVVSNVIEDFLFLSAHRGLDLRIACLVTGVPNASDLIKVALLANDA